METNMHVPCDLDAFVPLVGRTSPEPPTDRPEAGSSGEVDFFVSGFEDVKKQAYLEGFAEGEHQTLKQMSQQLDQQLSRWRQTYQELSGRIEQKLDAFLGDIEERTVSMSVKIAEKLIEREIKVAPDCVRERLRTALARYKSEPIIQVRANPNDRVLLEKMFAPAAEDPEQPKAPLSSPVSLVDDPAVEQGGFIVETPSATFDHTIRGELLKIETDLARLYEPTEG